MKDWALITGGTAGIGESFSRLLAKEGFNIVLVARDETRLQERAESLSKTFSIECQTIVADLATVEGCAKVEQYIQEHP